MSLYKHVLFMLDETTRIFIFDFYKSKYHEKISVSEDNFFPLFY